MRVFWSTFCGVGLAAEQVLQLNLRAEGTREPVLPRHQRLMRRSTVQVPLENLFYYYKTTLKIGTPPQNIDITVDTGSSDLWVMAPSNPFCKEGMCTKDTLFDFSASESFRDEKIPFHIRYGDFTMANGSFCTDHIQLGSAKVEDAKFAVATFANSTQCVFGIGLAGDEATAREVRNGEWFPTYDNVPMLLKSQGHIASNSYSLWLNNVEDHEGTILFGGVDHSKYKGTLGLVPLINMHPEKVHKPYSMHVMLHNMELTLDKEESVASATNVMERPLPVLLDSGTSFAYLPEDTVKSLAEQMDYSYFEEFGYYIGRCNTSGTLNLNFSGIDIPVRLEDLQVEWLDDSLNPVLTEANEPVCALAVLPSNWLPSYILGDIMLRSMYVAYDLDRYQIALAPANFEKGEVEVEAIRSGIPRATTAPGYFATHLPNRTEERPTTATQTSSGQSNKTGGVAPSRTASIMMTKENDHPTILHENKNEDTSSHPNNMNVSSSATAQNQAQDSNGASSVLPSFFLTYAFIITTTATLILM